MAGKFQNRALNPSHAILALYLGIITAIQPIMMLRQ
jgi:hypothetical protein